MTIAASDAFLLAYLPWRSVARKTSLEATAHARAIGALARHPANAAERRLFIDAEKVGEIERELDAIRARCGGAHPPLATPFLEACRAAGELASAIAASARICAHVALLRAGAPDDAELRELATKHAQVVRDGVKTWVDAATRTGHPSAIASAGHLGVFASGDLTPARGSAHEGVDIIVKDVDGFFRSVARKLDLPIPVEAKTDPSARELELLQQIAAKPEDLEPRAELARLMTARGEAAGEFIRLQLAGETHRAHELLQMHPLWSAPLLAHNARKIRFANGFPEEITIDAADLLARAHDILLVAPITFVRIRNARGRVGEIVRASWLGRLRTLDLDDQGVTDDDLVALAASPHVGPLVRLDLRYNPISARGIEALAASKTLTSLAYVYLDGNPDDPVDRLEYVDETSTVRVPTEFGKRLEAAHGPLRWLHPG